jgi:hypothetical protein
MDELITELLQAVEEYYYFQKVPMGRLSGNNLST